MDLHKLFNVLVVGGALIAATAATACSGDPDSPGEDAAAADAPVADAQSTPADASPDATMHGDYCGCAGQPGDCACGTSPCCWLVAAPCCTECPE